jgi:hypothetical protein
LNKGFTHFLEYWLPSLILVGVAIVQIYLAHTVNLTPWKGGGFGMFAAIDSPSMRVIAVEALTEEGEVINLDLFRTLSPSITRRLRSLPRKSDLAEIAPQLLGKLVVPITIRQQAAYQKLQLENVNLELIKQLDSNFKGRSRYKLKQIDDPVLPETIKQIKAVRLQWWRLRFDQHQLRLWTESLTEVVEAGNWL